MATGSLFKGQRLSDAQYRLCLYLETSRKGPEWWGLRERIAEALGWCVRKVSQVLTQLEALGLIRRIRRGTLTCKRAIELLWLGPRQGALLPQVHRSVNTSASANIVPSQERDLRSPMRSLLYAHLSLQREGIRRTTTTALLPLRAGGPSRSLRGRRRILPRPPRKTQKRSRSSRRRSSVSAKTSRALPEA
jgi:DNA-binding MarR family transcriptional regulator